MLALYSKGEARTNGALDSFRRKVSRLLRGEDKEDIFLEGPLFVAIIRGSHCDCANGSVGEGDMVEQRIEEEYTIGATTDTDLRMEESIIVTNYS